ncbi:PPK2 family polyphosphate kinase [Isoptericola variabilis]|uniref:Polyphosphate:nucleotide phosphotransferase, PPK2 family n=1 Tax=Isoptericola variabilis (strain 225) TaxID=743718 RepID=F6FW26_ISOV2|nr:PPK2 family polyphosphate kinase [Isoptericola variabilis]AEG44496.1 polyphosphate:nucleotide phosphotransferase, PPK2 family [Isoptericola variabilis 225]TWH26588.1 PPK2 family polyphosphate:nucleotide phosphotransferase [Isoptericola variabilis J7]
MTAHATDRSGTADGTAEARALAREWTAPPTTSLRWTPGARLTGIDPRSTPGWEGGKAGATALVAAHAPELSELQERLFAEGRSGGSRSMLLVLQGLDTAGKGGIVRHVVGLVDPQGVMHRSFGVPTAEEKAHGYLWRIRNALPRPGYIGVFDRSHYEQVLVVRVEGLEPRAEWEAHYDEMNAFEAEVAASGTRIVKVALVISRDEQKARLAERLERPDKHWKYNPGDIDTRLRWDDYVAAYQDMLDRTSTEVAPWHVVPADRKWFARLAVSELLLDALRSFDLGWPEADFDVEAEKRRLAAT